MPRARAAAALLALAALVGVSTATTAPVAGASVDRGSAKSYSLQKVGGSVVRWNPCESVHYTVNTTYAPAGALADTQAAVARIAKVSGLTFVYDGPTTTIPTSSGPRADGITIAWARRGTGTGRSDLLPGGSVLGTGGWNVTYVTTAKGGAVSGVHIVNGYVIVDTAANKLPGGFADVKGGTRGELLQHELGHAVGLNHVKDKSQLMYATLGAHSSLGAGDKAGLRKVGKPAGCTT
ncbi:matrixin family metalloprotease [Microlunatus antarcticus]|uniref:Peptidase M10 metallopeptidase domain-containing protein n=1 Tax=Microlunatus antarcticus TaxID=53388 RepID=A0A7W5JVW5_9ACTN|nr:hypothetical protein [Microlunatus antarcticus]